MLINSQKAGIITTYSHFFKISNPSVRLISLIYKFCLKYAVKNLVYERGQKPKFKVSNVFGVRVKDSVEFRFHIGQLSPFMKWLDDNYFLKDEIEIRSEPLYNPTPINVSLKEGWILKDYQEDVKGFITTDDLSDNHSRLVTMGTGTGKAQPLYSQIKIPGGWKVMGDVKVSDTVITKDGTQAKVTGVYPQGLKDVYKLTFSDGRVAESCIDHLWEVYCKDWGNESKIMTLGEIKEIGSLYKNKLYIDLIEPEITPEIELPEDPYIYGTKVKTTNIIEEVYLQGSIEQRIELLQGILDIAGNLTEHGNIAYETNNYEVTLNIIDLVRGLGGIIKVNTQSDKFNYDLPYSLSNTAFKLLLKFRQPYKYFRDKTKRHEAIRLNENSLNLKLRLRKINYVGQYETQCISIDHESQLYVTDNYVVTHNTVSALATVADMKTRVGIVILPTYIEKWAGDIVNCLTASPKDIMVIQGSDSLKSLINLAKANEFDSKFVLFSLKTLQNYYKAYETSYKEIDNEGYNCLPEDMFKLLGTGVVIIDEIHQHLHAVYKTLTYTHVPKVIGLSATFITEDPIIDSIQKLMFPRELRFDKVKMKKYIKAFAISYNFKDIRNSKIRTTEFNSKNYSHNAFEKSIMKHLPTLNNYLKLIKDLVMGAYVKDYIQGDKLMIFASSIKLCTKIVEYLKKEFPKYDIRRYVENDPYVNVIDADIRVSTVLSAGTAIDIPNLRAVIQTNSVQSPVSNLQAIGRLRELKDRDVKYFYIYSPDIPKQVIYHRKRVEQINDRIASLNELHSNILV